MEIEEFIELQKQVKDICAKYGKENVIKIIALSDEPKATPVTKIQTPERKEEFRKYNLSYGWTEQQEAILKKEYHDNMTDPEKENLCKLLNKTWGSIYAHKKKSPKGASHLWTKEQENLLTEHFHPRMTHKEKKNLSKLLGKNWDAIYFHYKYMKRQKNLEPVVADPKSSPEAHKCPYCDSDKIVKHGFRYTGDRGKIQKFKCLACQGAFVINDEYFRMRNSPALVKQVIILHKQGLSIRQIQNKIKEVSHVTVWTWITEFQDKFDTTDPNDIRSLEYQKKQMNDNDYMNKIEEAKENKEALDEPKI